MDGRTTVLLGAGASVEAGVPTSVHLTRAIADAVGKRWRRQTTMALNIAIGAIVAHDTTQGVGAYDGIDVERLFSAIQMLADRENVEIAPFVASWNAALDALGPGSLPSTWGRDFQRELVSGSASSLDRVFAEGVAAVARSSGSGAIFKQLGREMVADLRSCLAIEPGASDYLAPLASMEPGAPARVATLNYDRGLELMGESTGRTVSTGLPEWDGGSLEWAWDPDADIRLLKLHGSIDWREVTVHDGPRILGEVRPQRLSERRYQVDTGSQGEGASIGDLGLIFGQRGKLRSDGPFLAMLSEFDRWLSETDRLVVIGYSFRDDHINSLIRRWFNSEPTGGLTIVDPALAAGGLRSSTSTRGFKDELFWAMHRSVESGYELISPHALIAEGASTAIARLFSNTTDAVG